MTQHGPVLEIDFDTPIDRRGTQSEKYDSLARNFGRADLLSLWVADMDFAAPACVREALRQRVQHPVFGYGHASDALLDHLLSWYQTRHGWRISPAQLSLAPGVVPSLFACVNALTGVGDRILVPTPVYPPFFSAVETNHRALVQSPLLRTTDGYALDLARLEREAKAGAKMLLLCNPHNPVGRVWRVDELQALIDLALRYELVVVSDDIHCDLVYPEHTYTPLAKLAPQELRLITAISPSKTFNIPALNVSSLVVSHPADLRAIQEVFARTAIYPGQPLSYLATEAAYTGGAPWLDRLLTYLDGNRRWVHEAVSTLPGIRCSLPEASCLLWLDCRELDLDAAALRRFFIEDAGLALNDGVSFGQGGEGYMRLNFGTQRALLERAIAQLRSALR